MRRGRIRVLKSIVCQWVPWLLQLCATEVGTTNNCKYNPFFLLAEQWHLLFDIIHLWHSEQLPTGIELIFLHFIRWKHARWNYWFQELCNNTCTNAIRQLCKIKSNSFCHSIINRSMWTDAQEEKPSVNWECQKMLLYETCTSATLLACLQQCCIFHAVDRQRLATPSSRLLPGKMPLNSSTMQLHNICPSTILGYNQGNPEL